MLSSRTCKWLGGRLGRKQAHCICMAVDWVAFMSPSWINYGCKGAKILVFSGSVSATTDSEKVLAVARATIITITTLTLTDRAYLPARGPRNIDLPLEAGWQAVGHCSPGACSSHVGRSFSCCEFSPVHPALEPSERAEKKQDIWTSYSTATTEEREMQDSSSERKLPIEICIRTDK